MMAQALRRVALFVAIAALAAGCARSAAPVPDPALAPESSAPASDSDLASDAGPQTDPAQTTDPAPAPAPGDNEPASSEKPHQTVIPAGVQWDDDVSPADVPAELVEWVESQYSSEQPAHKVMTVGDATYIAVMGGLQRSGGYSIAVREARLPEAGGRPVIELELELVPPPPDVLTTAALTNPVRYFRISPMLPGEKVEVSWQKDS